ncbi:MAG TPA: asparagine synthase (glutamine-hydrolyzing) [Gemmatimonadaceae bacterium]|nr:asparagine synthase (glutamine-hydrolyzing) [Gemmatimonadaceae bacterium]
MCGIYGRAVHDGELDRDLCARRTAMLSHRGPDFIGGKMVDDVFFGHARLSILDLTPAGNQPFCDGESMLVYNGEIYNWRALHERYLPDEPLRSRSDTEVLLLLLKRMGSACLPLLNGMFAFAFYEPSTRTMLLARDTTGIKPLYFIADGRQFEFSSEIKNLDYTPDLSRLKEYMIFSRFGDDFLPYANVRAIPAGNYVELDCATGRWHQQPYREIESLVSREAYARLDARTDVIAELDRLMDDSVRQHEQSDAPIGFLCSGGLDSSLVAAMAARRHPDIALYHADFEGPGGEAQFAQQVARHVGAPLHQTRLTRGQFWELFPQVTHAVDLPVQQPTSVSLALIARQAHENGLKVLLSGEGADELFGGYAWHQFYKNSLSNYSSRWSPSKVLSRALRRFVNREGADNYLYFKYAATDFQRHAHVGFGFGAWSLTEPIHGLSLVGQEFQAWHRWRQALESYSWLPDRREADVQSFMLCNLRVMMMPLLHRLDRVLMLHSIEGRVPFLENGIFDFALNLALRYKIRGPVVKYALKRVAARYLPPAIVDRPKMGFTVPWLTYANRYPAILRDGFVSEWTRLSQRDLAAWCENDPGQLYKLIAIEVWGRIFVHREPWQSIRIDF